MPRLAPTLSCLVLATIPAAALAEPAAEPSGSRFTLGPTVGVYSEGAIVDGLVRFSDGDTDFISVEPNAGLVVGLELGFRFRPKLIGVLALSYGSTSADYIEGDNLRRDLDVSVTRIQPGVMFSVMRSGKTEVAIGGGLTIARLAIDNMIWNDRRIEPRSTSLGLFGAVGLDVALARRVAFHAHLALEANRPSYGGLEDELAFADGEAAASVDHDLRTALLLALGVSFAL